MESFPTAKNFGYGVVETAPSPALSGTSLTLQSGQGDYFPDTDTKGGFYVTIWPEDVQPNSSIAEIAWVSARSGDVLTIIRAQEGSSAMPVTADYQVAMTFTASTQQALSQSEWFEVEQAAHGFTAGNAIYHNGTIWVKAQANTAATLGTHIVGIVYGTDNFVAVASGRVQITGHGLTPGTLHHVSDSVAGALSTSAPSALHNPIALVEDANILHVLPFSGNALVTLTATQTLTNKTLTSPTLEGGAVFNETGAAVDLRVEGDTATHLLFVQGSTDRIGINTNSPSAKLDIVHSTSGTDGAAEINYTITGTASGVCTGLSFIATDNASSHISTQALRAILTKQAGSGDPSALNVVGDFISTVNATMTTVSTLRTEGSVGAGATLSTANHFQVTDYSGSGVVTTQNGINIGDLTKATINNAIVTNAGHIKFNNGGHADSDFTVKSDNYDALFVDASNDSVDIMHNASGKIGFFAATPVVRVAAYTVSNVTPDRSYNADATTVPELADIVGTLIADLQSYGLLQ